VPAMKPLPPVFIWTTACFASARAAGGTHSVFAIAVLTCVARLQILPPQSERASTYVAEFRFVVSPIGLSRNLCLYRYSGRLEEYFRFKF
jgi:hypothetical protein